MVVEPVDAAQQSDVPGGFKGPSKKEDMGVQPQVLGAIIDAEVLPRE